MEEQRTVKNLSNWMGELDFSLKNVSICYLAIPGSHDSLSYSVTRHSGLAPDAPNIAKFFYKLCPPLMKLIALNWSRTQNVDIKQQFQSGIRYFDIRVAAKDTKLYSCHALFGVEIPGALKIINQLLDEHGKEVVVLDFQHFYEMNIHLHQYLTEQIYTIFGNKLCEFPGNVEELTLRRLQDNKQQVIVIYRDSFVKTSSLKLWQSCNWITRWPNTTNISTLYEYLTKTLPHRPKNAGFVSQCVFTPTWQFIVLHLLSSLRKSCAIFCDEHIKSMWIDHQKSLSPRGVNVIIADFIDLPDFNFARTVIDLNIRSVEKKIA